MRASVPPEIAGPALENILQTMYFCEARYLGHSRLETPLLTTSLTFEGPVNGTFRVSVSEKVATRMAADFLALELHEVSPGQRKATVAEFANVACGAVMSAWIPSASFHYSVPGDFAREVAATEYSHCFVFDEYSPASLADLAFEVTVQ